MRSIDESEGEGVNFGGRDFGTGHGKTELWRNVDLIPVARLSFGHDFLYPSIDPPRQPMELRIEEILSVSTITI